MAKKLGRMTLEAKKRVQLAEFAVCMAAGLDQYQICEEMGLHTNEYESLRSRFYRELELEHSGKPTSKLYLDYVNRQGKLIRDLEDLKKRMRGDEVETEGKKQSKSETWASGAGAQAFVGAVRVQADIYDRMISTGQSLELIKKAPKRIEYIGGKHVANLTTSEIEEEIQKELKEAQSLVSKKKSKQAAKVLAFYPKADEG